MIRKQLQLQLKANLNLLTFISSLKFSPLGFSDAVSSSLVADMAQRDETPNPIWPPYERYSQKQDMSLKQDLRTRFITKSTSKQLFPLLSIASGYQNSALLDFMD